MKTMNGIPKRKVRYFICYARGDGKIADQFLTEL
jgi:hypothetical protein